MNQIPAYFPSIPFVGELPGGGRPGLVVKVKGQFTGHGRCNIDFVNFPTLDPALDIILHLSIRTKEKTVVGNSFQDGQWEEEVQFKSSDNINIRVKKDETFTLSIFAEGDEHYNMRINETVFGPFSHRLPLELVQSVRVSGENFSVEHVLSGDGLLYHFDM